MAKYGSKAKSKVKGAMHKKKSGTLKSGRSGRKVTSKKQAIAIGLSEARKEGGKAPKAKSKSKHSKSSKSKTKHRGPVKKHITGRRKSSRKNNTSKK